ncbi:MAG TPA: YggT family protein [Candidatus Limnocylindria bacterium]|nr:YggT family protein [Candidatus Limnocylindria bacterium]
MPGAFLVNFLRFVLIGLELVILARIVLSWVDPTGRSPFASFIMQTTEPILGPIRKMLPRTGMIDWSPLIVLLVLGVLLRVVG